MKLLDRLTPVLLLVGLASTAPQAQYGAPTGASKSEVMTFAPAPSDRFCRDNRRAISWLEHRYGTSAVYSYCSSLLHIPPATKTVTAGVTTAVVTVTRPTTVATTTPVVDVTQTSTTITYVRRNPAYGSGKATGPLQTYGAAIQSAVCSCLSGQIPRSTTTTTVTVTVRATTTKLEPKTATASVTATRVWTIAATCTAQVQVKDGEIDQALNFWPAYFNGNGSGFVGQQDGFNGYGLHVEGTAGEGGLYTVGFSQNVTSCRGAVYNINFARRFTGDQNAGRDCFFGASLDGFASYPYQVPRYDARYGLGYDGVNATYGVWQVVTQYNVPAPGVLMQLGFALVCPPGQSAAVTVDSIFLEPY